MNNRIRTIRKSVGLNQTDFGARIGVKQTAVAAWESGTRTPMDAIIQSICREFNVNELWLRTGEGEMFRKLDKMDELMEAVGRFFANETDEFRLRFVSAAIHFTDAQWQALEAYCKLLLGEDIPGSPPPASEENSSTTDAGNP